MIGRLRRWRLLTLLLLLVTPGVAGTVLDGLHPCPESMPWAAAAGNAEHGSHGGAHDAHGGDHDAPAHSGECHCVGACVGAAATIAFAPVFPTVALGASATSAALPHPADVPASRPSDRLPPSTAPPLV